MRVVIDDEAGTLEVTDRGGVRRLPLWAGEGLAVLADLWTRVGWECRYSYQFTWLGLPVIQLPEDIVTVQEVLAEVRPTVIVETGVAHGGSLILYASLLKAMGIDGTVIGVELTLRPDNRAAILAHRLAGSIRLVDGDSAAPEVVAQVAGHIGAEDSVMVLLDSDHSRRHVRGELEAYAPLVTPGSYLVATDGIMEALARNPSGRCGWADDNPTAAAREFAAEHPEFELLDAPARRFDESRAGVRPTYWPGGWLRRRS